MRCNISPQNSSGIMNAVSPIKCVARLKDTERAGEDSLEIVEVGRSVQIIGQMFQRARNARENSLQWA